MRKGINDQIHYDNKMGERKEKVYTYEKAKERWRMPDVMWCICLSVTTVNMTVLVKKVIIILVQVEGCKPVPVRSVCRCSAGASSQRGWGR